MFKKCAFPLMRIAIRSSRFYQPKPLFSKDSHLFQSHQLFVNPMRQYHKKQSESAPSSKDIDLIIRKSLSRPEFAELEAHIANTIQNQSALRNLHTEEVFKAYSAIAEEFKSIDINVLVKELLKSSKDEHLNYNRETVRFLKSFLFYDSAKNDNVSQYQEILSSKIALYIISTLAVKMSDPSNLGMLELCDTQLKKLIQFALEKDDIVQKLDKTEMKKTFLIYLKNAVFFPSQTVKMVNGFIVLNIKKNEDFSQDFFFLLEAAKGITRNITDKDIDETQLLSNETPFQPIAESANSLPNSGEEIVQSDNSTDIIAAIQDIIREKITSNTSIMTLKDLQLCLNILSLTRLELRESIEHVIIKLQTILKSGEQIDRASLIKTFIKVIVQVKPNTPFFRELLKESLNITYKFLDAAPLTTRECSKIYTIFRHTQTVYPPLLGHIKDKLHSNISKLNLESFLNTFFFYASLPGALNEDYMIPERELNMYIKQKFNELTFENIIDIAMASIQLGFEDKVSSIDYLPTLDHELWNKILSIMMQTNVQSLTLKEKIKFFRCLKVLSLVIDQEVFNYTLIEEKLKSLGSVRASFDFIESEFQLEVERCLKNIGKVYEKEKTIEDLLSIDFLVPKKKVLEVNGPSHYFIVFDSDKGSYHENKSTALKRKLLQMLNYKYYAVSFYDWFGIESTFDKENHIIYLLSRTHDVY